MPNNKPMNPVQAQIYFQLSDVEPGILTIPQEVYDKLNEPVNFRRVEHEGYLIIGSHLNGCGDQAGREVYYIATEDLSKGIPHWLQPIRYEVRIQEDGGFKIPVSIALSPCHGNNTLNIVSENWALALEAHRALASLTDLTYCAACGCASHKPAEEGSYEPGKGWHCAACHRRLFDSRP